MPKIVILGAVRFAPYEILIVPHKMSRAYNTDEGYEIASKKFYPAIDKADLIIAYVPEGIGEHTKRDIQYALQQGKKVWMITCR